MSLSPERKASWLANIEAAGIEADTGTLERIEGGLAERVDALNDLLDRLEYRSKNPDYLRDTSEKERADGDA